MSLSRPGADVPILAVPAAAGTLFHWAAAPGREIVLTDEGAFVIDGPAVNEWSVCGVAPDGRHFCATKEHPLAIYAEA